MKTINYIAIFILFFSNNIYAKTIVLKSGERIEGRILEFTKDYIRIEYNGNEANYENKDILKIENNSLDIPATQEKQISSELNSNSSYVNTEIDTLSRNEINNHTDSETVNVTPKKIQESDVVAAVYLEKGLKFASEGNFEEAEKEFKEELSDINGAISILEDVKNGTISKEYATYLFQGSLYLINTEYQKAITVLEKAWEINPGDSNVNYNLGLAYFSLGEYEKAILYLSVVLKLQPEDTQVQELISRIYYERGQCQKVGNSDSVTEIDKSTASNAITKSVENAAL